MRTRPGPVTYNPPGTVAGMQSKWDAGIMSLVDLAAVSTLNLNPIVIRAWINSDDGTEQVWRLVTSTAATDGVSIQRPNDFDATSNPKVWFKASS